MFLSTELDRLRVVLVAARNPLNIGAVARAMSNFGFSRLRVVNPFEVAFREARSAVGASSVLAGAEQFKTVAEAVADCTLVIGTTAADDRKLQHPLRQLNEGARLIRRRLKSTPVAILFGSEKRGLSNQDFSYCHWLMRIPTRPDHSSMNLGQAVAVCLYELTRTGKALKADKAKLPTAAEIDRITGLLIEALHLSGFVRRGTDVPTEEKVRRLVRRLNIPARDTEMWLSMLRQILWRLRSQRP